MKLQCINRVIAMTNSTRDQNQTILDWTMGSYIGVVCKTIILMDRRLTPAHQVNIGNKLPGKHMKLQNLSIIPTVKYLDTLADIKVCTLRAKCCCKVGNIRYICDLLMEREQIEIPAKFC